MTRWHFKANLTTVTNVLEFRQPTLWFLLLSICDIRLVWLTMNTWHHALLSKQGLNSGAPGLLSRITLGSEHWYAASYPGP